MALDPRSAGASQGVLVILSTLLPVLAIISLAPALPTMLAHFAAVSGSPFLVPAALTMPGLCIALFSAPMGAAVDRFGRRSILLPAMMLYGIAGMVPLMMDDLHVLLISRFALGIAEAAIMTSASTLLADYFDGPVRARWIALQAATLSIAATVLYLVGGLLTSLDWRAPFLLYGFAFPLALFAGYLLWEPKRDSEAVTQQVRGQSRIDARWFAWVLAVTLAGAIIFYVAPIQAGVLLAANGVHDPAKAGLLGSVGTIGVPFGAWFFRRSSHRSIAGLLATAFLCAGLGLAGMGWLRQPIDITVAMILNQFGCGVLLSSLIHWTMNGLPAAGRGRGIGIWTSAFFLGQFTSPLVIASLAETSGVRTAFFLSGGLAALLGISMFFNGLRRA